METAISKSKHSHLPPGGSEHLPPGMADVLPLSHEISEWINDPFINNFVPPWQFPGIPGSCQGNLETGDPLEVLRIRTPGDHRRIHVSPANRGNSPVVSREVPSWQSARL